MRRPVPPPTEYQAQCAVVAWARQFAVAWPSLELLYAVANGEKRTPKTGAKLKNMGVLPGMCDLVLPSARRGWHGLYLELKAEDGSVSSEQREVHAKLSREGYLVRVPKSQHAAMNILEWYVTGPRTQVHPLPEAVAGYPGPTDGEIHE